MMERVSGIVLAGVLIAVLGWPTLATILSARQFTAGDIDASGAGLMAPTASDLAAGRVQRPLELAATTIRLVLLTEIIALPIGLPLAFLLFRTDVWGRRVLLGLLALAAFIPMPLHATSWIGGFGNAGRMQALGGAPLLVGLSGAAFVHAMAALPWIVLLAGVGLRTVEPELEESAVLEWPAWQVVGRVTLRRAVGAFAGAGLAVAVLTAGDMTVTDLLQVRSYAEEAYLQFQLGQGPAAAAGVAIPPLLVLGTLVLLMARALLRADPARLASAARPGHLWLLGRWRIPLGLLVAVTAGVAVLLPLVTLVWRAGRVGGVAARGQPPVWTLPGLLGTLRRAALDVGGSFLDRPLETALKSGRWSDLRSGGPWLGDPLDSPLIQSLLWGALGATVALLLAWGLAWRSREPGPWRWIVAGSLALALAAPGPVAGMALVLAYREWPRVYDSPLILVLVFILRTFPYALLVLWPAVRALPRAYLETAVLEGAGEWGTLRRVVFPTIRGALTAAWCVAFVLALGELPAANLVAPPGTGLIAIEIWSLLHTGVESHLAGVALLMLAAITLGALGTLVALTRIVRS